MPKGLEAEDELMQEMCRDVQGPLGSAPLLTPGGTMTESWQSAQGKGGGRGRTPGATEGKGQCSQMDAGPQAGSPWGWGPLCSHGQRARAWPGCWNRSLIAGQLERSPAPSGAKTKVC